MAAEVSSSMREPSPRQMLEEFLHDAQALEATIRATGTITYTNRDTFQELQTRYVTVITPAMEQSRDYQSCEAADLLFKSLKECMENPPIGYTLQKRALQLFAQSHISQKVSSCASFLYARKGQFASSIGHCASSIGYYNIFTGAATATAYAMYGKLGALATTCTLVILRTGFSHLTAKPSKLEGESVESSPRKKQASLLSRASYTVFAFGASQASKLVLKTCGIGLSILSMPFRRLHGAPKDKSPAKVEKVAPPVVQDAAAARSLKLYETGEPNIYLLAGQREPLRLIPEREFRDIYGELQRAQAEERRLQSTLREITQKVEEERSGKKPVAEDKRSAAPRPHDADDKRDPSSATPPSIVVTRPGGLDSDEKK